MGENIKFNYYKKRGYHYDLYDPSDIFVETTQRIAVAILEKPEGEVELISYGNYYSTKFWFKKYEKRFKGKPGESLVLIQKDFEADEINKLIRSDDYVTEWYMNLKENQ